jgi:hypothetical protein
VKNRKTFFASPKEVAVIAAEAIIERNRGLLPVLLIASLTGALQDIFFNPKLFAGYSNVDIGTASASATGLKHRNRAMLWKRIVFGCMGGNNKSVVEAGEIRGGVVYRD